MGSARLMTFEHLKGFDLNLLLALDGLLTTRSVTKTAQQLGLTQPAMSRTLGRLRTALKDPVLVRTGHQMVPTPRAMALSVPLRAALLSLETLVREGPVFDPARAQRIFRIATADYSIAVLVP